MVRTWSALMAEATHPAKGSADAGSDSRSDGFTALKANRVAEADPMFTILVFDPHLPSSLRPAMSSVLEKIKAKDAAGALKILTEEEAKAKAAAERQS